MVNPRDIAGERRRKSSKHGTERRAREGSAYNDRQNVGNVCERERERGERREREEREEREREILLI